MRAGVSTPPALLRGGWRLVLLLSALAVAGGGACAKRMGARASQGALEEIQRRAATPADGDQSARPASVAAQAAVTGAVQALSAPEQAARIREMVNMAVSEAIEEALATATRGGEVVEGSLIETASTQAANALRTSLTGGLAGDLEPTQGPLGLAAARLAEEVSASAMRGVLVSLAPTCPAGEDPGCLARQLGLLAHESGQSFVRGIRDGLGVWPIVLPFLLGVLVSVLGFLGWYLVHRRRHPPPSTEVMGGVPASAGAR